MEQPRLRHDRTESPRYASPSEFVNDYALPVARRHFACPQAVAVYFDGSGRLIGRQTLAIGPLPRRRIDLKRLVSLVSVPAGAQRCAVILSQPGLDYPALDDDDHRTAMHLWSFLRARDLEVVDVLFMGEKGYRSAAVRAPGLWAGW